MLLPTTTIPIELTNAFFDQKNKHMEKSVLFFLALKSLEWRSCGYIKNYKSRLQEIASLLNCSESTLRRRVAELKQLGLISHHKKSIALRSYSHLCSLYNIKDSRRYFISLDIYLQNPRFVIEHMALSKSIAQQQYIINKKVNDILSSDQRRNNKTRRIAKAKLNEFHKNNGISFIDAVEQLNFNVRTESSFENIVNPSSLNELNTLKSKTALSCIGMSLLIGRKSAITGSKRLRKMTHLNMIKRSYRYKVLYYGNEAKQALSYLRNDSLSTYMFRRGDYILSPIACSIDVLCNVSSSKVNTLFDRNQ